MRLIDNVRQSVYSAGIEAYTASDNAPYRKAANTALPPEIMGNYCGSDQAAGAKPIGIAHCRLDLHRHPTWLLRRFICAVERHIEDMLEEEANGALRRNALVYLRRLLDETPPPPENG